MNGKRESLACFIELIDSRDDQDSLIESTRTQQEHLKSIGVIDGMDIVRKIPMLAEFHYSQAIEICLKSMLIYHPSRVIRISTTRLQELAGGLFDVAARGDINNLPQARFLNSVPRTGHVHCVKYSS